MGSYSGLVTITEPTTETAVAVTAVEASPAASAEPSAAPSEAAPVETGNVTENTEEVG
jgi:hypothetical protein